jgi:hypothetical protein
MVHFAYWALLGCDDLIIDLVRFGVILYVVGVGGFTMDMCFYRVATPSGFIVTFMGL